MVLSNEQSRMAVVESRNIISCACADIASWLSIAATELHHSLVPPVDMVYYAYKEDLRGRYSFINIFYTICHMQI